MEACIYFEINLIFNTSAITQTNRNEKNNYTAFSNKRFWMSSPK
mgnify:CR=1 FL=1|jgi:hypothetical protein